MKLIVVESPTKIKSFRKILGKEGDYEFFATLGHFRDLPKKKLGVEVENNFKPEYKISKEKAKVVKALKELGKRADELILATDPDREGEAIAYHTAYVLGLIEEDWPEFKLINGGKVKRIIFHEITPSAIKEAIQQAGKLRESLVKAQFARRILDRLVGYTVSPLLWKKVGKNWLSAGRVQTVALRLIVEREKERENFERKKYFVVFGNFLKDSSELKAELKKVKGEEIEVKETLQLFAGPYTFSYTKINEKNVDKLKKRLEKEKYFVSKYEEKIVKRTPPPPLTTSLMQQEAARRFGYSSKYTMKLAQDLYERGIITYHRTDSFHLSPSFIFKARKVIESSFGKDYLSGKPRQYKTKSKLAQEAHEAIRPTNPALTPEKFNLPSLTSAHKRLYSLIYLRALATQMKEAEVKLFKVEIESKQKDLFLAKAETIVFPGFLKAFGYKEKKETGFRNLKEGEELELKSLEAIEKETAPPPRYTEASLIKTLEEKGIGRPSTYAPIVSLIQERRYVEKKQRYFVPTLLGKKVCEYLTRVFPNLFNLEFTAKMEDELDKIANKNEDLIKVLKEFYNPFEKSLKKAKEEKGFIDVEEKVDEKCPLCGRPLVIRYSKYGKFYACSGYPECKYTRNYVEKAEGVKCPKCGGAVVIRRTKKGKKFYGCENYPKCDWSVWKLSQIEKK